MGRDLLARRAIAAVRRLAAHGMDAGTALRSTSVANELLGGCLMTALAWRAVQVMHDRLGEERFRALMRAALAGPAADDARALVSVRSTAALLEQAGLPPSTLARDLRQALARTGAAPAPATLQVDVSTWGGSSEVRYRVPEPVPAGLNVRFKVLKPMDSPDDTQWAGNRATGVLPATFASGARVLVTANAPDPDLQCQCQVGTVRLELP